MLFVFLLAAVLGVACKDRFRYPCQDPANHGTFMCTEPACEADGTCTKYLMEVANEK